MSTLTKEWLLKTIAELEEERDAVPGVVNEDAARALAAMKLALASLEAEKNAEPVAKVETVGVCWYADNGVPRKPALGTELYTAPPAPVVDADDNFYSWFGREWHEHYQQNQYTTAAKQMLGVMAESAWKAGRRAAMLQGADQAPVKQPSSNSVLGWLRADYQDDNRGLRGNAPLFVLGKKDPSTVWGLDYIPLTSNSPVIPDGWLLVPVEPTMSQEFAGYRTLTDTGKMSRLMKTRLSNIYRAMIATAPQQEVK
ncbi:hypothetical protein ACUW1X_002720 [Enterobacter hormaechei]